MLDKKDFNRVWGHQENLSGLQKPLFLTNEEKTSFRKKFPNKQKSVEAEIKKGGNDEEEKILDDDVEFHDLFI